MTSLSTYTELYRFTERIDAEINTKSERLQLTAHLNGKNVSVPNLPLWFNRHFDAKYDRPEQMAFNFGYARKFFLRSQFQRIRECIMILEIFLIFFQICVQ